MNNCIAGKYGLDSASPGGYFMAQEEKDAVIGRVARERKEAETLVASLRSEARCLGELFSDIGNRLINEPEYVVFEEGGSTNIRYVRLGQALSAKKIDGSRLIKLTADLRGALDRLELLRQEAVRLGI